MSTAITIRGCVDCPFAEELWAGCKHPTVTPETSLAVSGISDTRLKRGARPDGCPLTGSPITISLKPPMPPKPKHNRKGNCHAVALGCRTCARGDVCDVCHTHDEPRGSCSQCPQCSLCVDQQKATED